MAAANAGRPLPLPLSIIVEVEEPDRARLSLDGSVPGLLGAYLRRSGNSAVSATGQAAEAGDSDDNSAADDDEPEDNQPGDNRPDDNQQENSAAGAAADSAEGAAVEGVAGAAEKHPKCPAGKTETPDQTRARVAENRRKNLQGFRKVYGKKEWVKKEEPPPPGPQPHKTTKYVDRERIPANTCTPKTIRNDLNKPIAKDEKPSAAGAQKVTAGDAKKTLASQMQTRAEVNLIEELGNRKVKAILRILRYSEHLGRSIVLVERGLHTLDREFYNLRWTGGSKFFRSAVDLLRKCTRGLAELAKQRCAHRDVKAQNVMVDRDHEPKYIDFGFARIDQDRAGFSGFMGSVGHQAPELVLKSYDCKVDVFSLGRTFLHCLTGQSPFLAECREIHQFIIALDYYDKLSPADKKFFQQNKALPDEPHLKKKKQAARREAMITTFDLTLAEMPCKAMDALLGNADLKGFQHLIRWATSYFPAERPTAQQLADHPLFHVPRSFEVTSFELDDGAESALLEINQYASKDDLENGKVQRKISIPIPDIGNCDRDELEGTVNLLLTPAMRFELRLIFHRAQKTCRAVVELRANSNQRPEELIAERADAIDDWKEFRQRGEAKMADALREDPDKQPQAAPQRPVERRKGGSEGCAEGEQVGRALPQLEGLLGFPPNVQVRRPRVLEGDPPEFHRLFYSDDEDEGNIDFSGFVSVLKPAEDADAPPSDGEKRERVFALKRCYGHYCVLKNLPTVNWTAERLKSELVPQFRKFGRCIDVDVGMSKNPESFGERYIYCDYKQAFEAQLAVQMLDKFELDGHFLDAIYKHKQNRLGGPRNVKEAELYVNRVLLTSNSQVPCIVRIDGLPYDYTKKELYDMASQAGGNIVDHSIFGQKERPEHGSFGIIAFADEGSSLAFIDGIKDGSLKDEYYPHLTLSAEAITSKTMPLLELIDKSHSIKMKSYQSADGEVNGNEEATIARLPAFDLSLSADEVTAWQRVLARSDGASPDRYVPQEERDATRQFAKMALSWPKE